MKTEKNKGIKPSVLTPRTKKIAAKKTVQAIAAHVATKEGSKVVAKSLPKIGVKALAKTGTQTLAKTGVKVGAKGLARGIANPWLLAADGVDLGVRKACENLDMDKDTAKIVGKGSGLAASIGIGTAVGGPVGAVAGLALWGIGEGISKLFDLD